MLSSRQKIALKLFVTTILVMFLVQKIEWVEVFAIFNNVNLLFFSLAFGLIVVGTFVSASKWQYILLALGHKIPLWQLFRYYYIGSFFNMFFPGVVGGDVVRI